MKKDLIRFLNFFSLFKKHWLSYCVSTAMVSCRNLFITWIMAYISSRVITVVSGGGEIHLLMDMAFFLIILVSFCLFDCIGIYAQTISIQRISNLLRQRLYRSFLFASIPEMDRNIGRSELITRADRDIATAGNLLAYGIVAAAMSVISGLGATIIIGNESLWICVFLYSLGFSGLFLQNALAKRMRIENGRMQKDSSEALSVYIQTVSQSADIRMANLGNTVKKAFEKCMTMFRKHSRRFCTVSGVSSGIDVCIRFVGFVGTIGLCMYQYANHGMTLAAVVLVIQMAELILNMILSISSSITTVHTSLVGIDRIFEMLNLPAEDQSGKEFQKDVRSDEPLVMIQNAACTFSDGTSAFTNMNMEIPANCVVALGGESGSGKSTLMRIMLKIYPYSLGSIRLLGQEIQACSAISLRNQVGYVPQENLMFSGTVKENLMMGNHHLVIGDDEIKKVIKGIGADTWINELPNGIDTPISEGGNNLSGGQRQMLSIARALLCKQSIMILDEAFDGIDDRHIQIIMDYIRKSPFLKSIIVVTHDRQVANRCDFKVILK